MSTDVDAKPLLSSGTATNGTAAPSVNRAVVHDPTKPRLRAIAVHLLRPARNLLFGLYDYAYDFWRFTRHSSAAANRYDREQLSALVTKHYHNVEKGLALPEPRPGFGQQNIDRLIALVRTTEATFGPNTATRGARDALAAYVAFHRPHGQLFPRIEALLAEPPDGGSVGGGTIMFDRQELRRYSDVDFATFAQHRYSIRQFTGAPIAEGDLRAAIAVAAKSPSVCNRATCKAYVLLSEEKKKLALSFQNGNRGFGHLAGAIVVVTSDLRGFVGFEERNQCWVDGGLFAMSLNYALHAQGYGVCMLNWSAPAARDRRMRRALGIPAWAGVITMMAVGHIPDRVRVAASPRRNVADFIEILD